jgi:GT2 family glycosyltransferase
MSGWVLIDGQSPNLKGRGRATFAGEGGYLRLGDITLSVLATGRVHEIVFLHNEVDVAELGSLSINKIGWLDRIWRMGWRVFNMWSRLSGLQRRNCGLTLWCAVFDLPAAYRIATLFRGISYQDWIKRADSLTDRDKALIRTQIANWQNPPQFRVVLVDGGVDAMRQATLASLDAQLYRNFTTVTGENEMSDGWVMILRPGDLLSAHALYWFACEAQVQPYAAMIYADDDEIDDQGVRCHPRFKPDWSLTHLRATDFIGRAVVINGHAVTEVGGLRSEHVAGGTWDLLLRVAEAAGDRVAHIPAVLLHRDVKVERAVVPVFRRLRFDLPLPLPLVSIVIPTRDAVALLRQCVESVLGKTTYSAYEVVVVDNGSTDPAALDYLAEIAMRTHVRVLRYDHPFNFSGINNFAAQGAKGAVLCLLNNDTELISPDWLEEMVGHLLQEKVGVVGAKLYYPDGRVQHAGDTVGPGGCADHLHSFIDHDDPGYCNRAAVAQELSAVTAACMATWRDLYLRLGGLDEKNLPVAFNDVDYCLRVRKAGYRVVWTPHAELFHHESVSRGRDKSWKRKRMAEKEVRYMRHKWCQEMKNDPFYNPNFSYFSTDFSLWPAPNVKRPWLSK